MTVDRPRRGQALAEFALVLPLLMLILLGFGEAAFLAGARHSIQNGVDVMADVAAERGELPQSVINAEAARAQCANAATSVTYPDGGAEPGDRVWVDLSCAYSPRITRGLWEGLTIRVQGSSVIRSSAEPSPSAAP